MNGLLNLLEGTTDALPQVQIREGERLFKQGEMGSSMYIVLDGRLQALVNSDGGDEIPVGEILPGEPVGELQFFTGGKRTASVAALVDTTLIQLASDEISRLQQDHPAFYDELQRLIFRRLGRNHLLLLLPNLFGEMKEEEIRSLEAELEWHQVSRGERLIKQGDRGNAMFIVLSGQLQVAVRDEEGEEHPVLEISEGETVGEMALFNNDARTASVYALRDSLLVRISKEAFFSTMARFPVLHEHVTRVMMQRLQVASQVELREKELHAEAEKARADYLHSENMRQTQELEAARKLQLSMLPQHVPEHPSVELAVFMQTAAEVGGDYYDFDLAEDGALSIVIGDATGHGTRAGMMVTATKSLWSAFSQETKLTTILEKSGRALKKMGLSKLYMALAVVRITGHTVTFAGAGMPPALLHRAKQGQVEEIPLKGMPLGGPVAFPYREVQYELAAGDTLLLMSDGFPELFNDDGEMLGYKKAVEVFGNAANKSLQDILSHLETVAREWRGNRKQDDDVTFVAMRFK